MTASTYCPNPRQVFKTFDQLTASTTHQILNSVARDKLSIYSEIIRFTKSSFLTQDEAQADVLYLLTEEAHKRPHKFVERYNSNFWRFFFTSFCKNIFGSKGSANKNWKPQQINFFEDAPDPFYQEDDRPEQIQDFFVNCIELVDQSPFKWYEKKFFAFYRFDVEDWLKYDWIKDDGTQVPPPRKMTYDYISNRTGVSRTSIFKSVKKVEQYIKDNYEDHFGSPPIS